MNKKFDKLGFYPADILLPKGQDMNKWAVVACDQFTSEPLPRFPSGRQRKKS